MSKTWPDVLGTFKGMVVDTAFQKSSKSGMPTFVVRVYLTEYWDQKAGEWYDVSDNNWTLNGYFTLYGRKSAEGEIEATLNHSQVCKVFNWDGCGFASLTANDFSGKTVQVRIAENDYPDAKSPVQIRWIDTEDADPNAGLTKLSADEVKDMEKEFAHLWGSKKTVVSAPKTAAQAPRRGRPPKNPTPAAEPPKETAPTQTEQVVETAEDRKKKILEKSRRLRDENSKVTTPPKKDISVPPKVGAPPAEKKEEHVPADYDKKKAWFDVVEMKSPDCTDETLQATWHAAISELAEDGNEDKLDADGWWAVKEQVLSDVGVF